MAMDRTRTPRPLSKSSPKITPSKSSQTLTLLCGHNEQSGAVVESTLQGGDVHVLWQVVSAVDGTTDASVTRRSFFVLAADEQVTVFDLQL